jgi:uroporphyrin-III C-methyltransferase
MGVANITEIATRLLANGLPPDLPVLAMASVTTPRERRLVSCLDAIAGDIAEAGMEAPVLFVIGHVVSLYGAAVLADALACDGAGMAAYA